MFVYAVKEYYQQNIFNMVKFVQNLIEYALIYFKKTNEVDRTILENN